MQRFEIPLYKMLINDRGEMSSSVGGSLTDDLRRAAQVNITVMGQSKGPGHVIGCCEKGTA